MRLRDANAKGFCRMVENRLGWAPENQFARKATVDKVAAKVESNPELYTWQNLALAVELLAREKVARSPLGVFAHVERALKVAKEKDDDLETQIQEAIRIESHRGDPDGWIIRFARSTGWWRAEAYKEWRNEQAKPR